MTLTKSISVRHRSHQGGRWRRREPYRPHAPEPPLHEFSPRAVETFWDERPHHFGHWPRALANVLSLGTAVPLRHYVDRVEGPDDFATWARGYWAKARRPRD